MTSHKDPVCAKSGWIMQTLTEEGPQETSRALDVHLASCDGCRRLAASLRAANDALDGLTSLEPPDALADRADARLTHALAGGARLTGRVPADEIDVADPAPSARKPVGMRWLNAAAIVGLAAGLYMVAGGGFRAEQGTQPVPGSDTPLPTVARRVAPVNPPVVVDPPAAVDPPATGELPEIVAEQAVPPTDIVLEDERIGVFPTPPKRRLRICRHRTHLEAALCPRSDCAHVPVVLPNRPRP